MKFLLALCLLAFSATAAAERWQVRLLQDRIQVYSFTKDDKHAEADLLAPLKLEATP